MKEKFLISILLLGCSMMSCKKEDVLLPNLSISSLIAGDANNLYVTTTLSGTNEVPAVTTTATGEAYGSYSRTTKVLNLNVGYEAMTPTAWHIHKGAIGANGGVVFNLGADFKSPFAYTTPLTAEQETDLLAGLHYLNIHSAKAPGGEVRGNLKVGPSTATGSITGAYNPNTKALTLSVSHNGLKPTAWHIHKGAVGIAGPVVFDLGTNFASPYTHSATLTTEQEADLKAGLYYINIHTKLAPNGEIRGQLSAK